MFQWLRSLIFTVQMYLMMAVIGIGMLPLALVETEICLFNRAYLLPLGDVDRRLDGWPENRISRQAPNRRGVGCCQTSKFLGCSDDCVTNSTAQIYHEILA